MKDIDAQRILEAYSPADRDKARVAWSHRDRDEQGPVAQVGQGLDEIVQNIELYFQGGAVDGAGSFAELNDDPDINLAGELKEIMIAIVKGKPVRPPYSAHQMTAYEPD